MRKFLVLLIVLFVFSLTAQAKESKWWLKKPYRLYQSNLRDIDVDFDVDEYMRGVKEYKATAMCQQCQDLFYEEGEETGEGAKNDVSN